MQWQPMLYGVGLNRVNLSPYSQHFKKSVGLGTTARTSGFYVRARENPLNESNTAVNVLDNEKGIDHQAKKTDFSDPKINHSAEDVPGYVPEEDPKKEHFKPIAASESELKEVVACKRKHLEDVHEAGGHGDDLRITKVPCAVIENAADDPSVVTEAVPHQSSTSVHPPIAKKKKVYKGPTHRLKVTEDPPNPRA